MSKARVISGYGETGSFKQVTVTSNITMTSYTNYYVDTTSVARTLTLPTAPTVGDEIHIFDTGNNAGTNNITIASNSYKLNGSVQDLAIDVNGAGVVLIYTGSFYGWRAG